MAEQQETEAESQQGTEPKQDKSYNLLCEEDPEEFVNVEIPPDPVQSDPPPLGGRGQRRLRPLHGRLRASPVVSRRNRVMETQEDISQLSTEDELVKVCGEGGVKEERVGGDIVGSASLVGEDNDPNLRSDMLISLTASMAEMSVRQSLHIGMAAADLRLPSDEETAKEATRMRLDSAGSEHREREFEDEDVESVTWSQHQKHIFILSISGKPVYSRYGKEDKLVNLFGIMQALVSFVQDDRDNLRTIVAGEHQIVFICRGPLVLVAVAKSRMSDQQLALQLLYAYNQVLSVLTNTQLQQIFERNPGFDLRYLLQGSEKFVDNILNMVDTDPSFILSGVRCLAMPVPLRQTITNIFMQCRTKVTVVFQYPAANRKTHLLKDVLFIVLVTNNQLITYIKPKEHNLVPLDIHLIFNLVDASTSFRSAESWTPLCLPKFNDTGFLHAHVSYLPHDSPACLLLISTDKEKFFALQDCQQRIVEKLERHGCVEALQLAVADSPYTIDHLLAPDIRHFVYKSRKTSCVTSPKIPIIYSDKEDRERLFELYMLMHQKLHSQAHPIKILYQVGEKEALLGWRTAGFDLYAVFDPLIAKSQAILLGNKLIRWINKEEERLIITSSHTF